MASEHNEGNTKLERRFNYTFFNIRPSQGLLPVLGLLEWYMRPILDAACLLALGRVLIWVEGWIG